MGRFCSDEPKDKVVDFEIDQDLYAIQVGRRGCQIERGFRKNGYPSQLVERIIRRTIESKKNAPVLAPGLEEPKEHFVHIRLPWIGSRSTEFRRDIQQTVRRSFQFVTPRVIFTTSRAFSGKAKDVLPAMSKSSVVYEFRCSCGLAYIGKTIQRLSERIKQHVPNKLLLPKPALQSIKADSAITKHLKENPRCISEQLRSNFTVLSQARTKAHLDVLEALFIRSQLPELCSQKDFVRVLSLF